MIKNPTNIRVEVLDPEDEDEKDKIDLKVDVVEIFDSEITDILIFKLNSEEVVPFLFGDIFIDPI